MKRRTTLRECEFCGVSTTLKIRKCCKEGMISDTRKTVHILISGKIDNKFHTASYQVLGVSKTPKKLIEKLSIINSCKSDQMKLKPHTNLKHCWVNSMEYYEIIEREIL